MKNLIVAILSIAMASISVTVRAQEFTMGSSADGYESLDAYKTQRLEDLPYIQAFQADDGRVLKAADTEGFGIEIFGAYHYAEGYHTPEAGISGRYDAKKVSYRISISATSREYNDESVYSGEKYWSYAADAALHVNLLNRGTHENVWSLYGTAGYIYGRHRYAVGETQTAEGTLLKTVKHNGSGLAFGGGTEYRRQFFASGNALIVRVGYKTLPNTFVNNTKIKGTVYVQVGFTFGCARNRVRTK